MYKSALRFLGFVYLFVQFDFRNSAKKKESLKNSNYGTFLKRQSITEVRSGAIGTGVHEGSIVLRH